MKNLNSSRAAGVIKLLMMLAPLAFITSCQRDAQVLPSSSTNAIGSTFTSKSLATAYTVSAPISYYNKSNITISGLSITGGSNCIALYNCTNVIITNCSVGNSSGFGIMLNNCKNIYVQNCFITNVKSGVHVYQGSGIAVNSNQFLNMNGPFPDGCFVQFASVTGGGNRIMYNRCENVVGIAQHPQDGISLYKSSGIQGDSIMIYGNWLRGGQVQFDSGGAAGIVLGDLGGSYQVARQNYVLNSGYVGMQVVGGSNIKMDHNFIYSSSTPVSNTGINCGNYSGASSYNINISYNQVKWYQKTGAEWDLWLDNVATPTGWSTNIQKANISASILPATIITMQ
ncbi:right-handed parallel beta-helix repeat-containing protein [Mucilaginibacter sp. BT774]|uniref:right-handed parallel beta-helix repeat-containing protein n=1 Tax=Mucilaginibacter sp. BT774 TaxID=3062276 RepID=UPI002674F8EF|nr:right-handed parallel beta-helix repeat-containing protein [Mucilaginibacter sp. BT774]MDO3625807.1 right-handed parallel beta-helix repeat-containing protein [Mucilaginibacter sp. BT774]